MGSSSLLFPRRLPFRVLSLLAAVALATAGAVTLDVVSPAQAKAATISDVTQRPDQVSALLAARLVGHRVEITDERTESTTTYANPDGTLTTDSFAGPIRVMRDGGWVDVDTTLQETSTGVAPKAVPNKLALSDGGSGDVVDASGSNGTFGFGWAAKLPKPTLDGDTATYPNVADGVDLIVQATRRGFEVSLRLTKRPTSPLSLKLPVTASGWSVTQAADGSLQLTDKSGAVVATANAPFMYDATTDQHSDTSMHSSPVSATLQKAGGATTLLLKPDQTFLSDPSTVYPVTIDPSATLSESADTWVESDYSSSQYGSTELRVGTYNGGSAIARSYLKFSTSPVSGKHVTAATLHVYENWSYSCSGRYVDVRRLTSSFGSSTTWANKPTMGGSDWDHKSFAAGYSSSCPDAWETLDLGNLVQDWVTGYYPNYGIALIADNEADSYGWKKFNSGDASSRLPYVSTTYNSYPNTPTSQSTSPSVACVTGSTRPYVNTTTPTLKATVSDADGGSLYGSFYMNHTGGAQVGTERLGSHVSSGSASSMTVPSGWLASGNDYSWKVRGWDGTDYSKSWTGWCEFWVDTVAPTLTTDPVTGLKVNSTDFPVNAWSSTASGTLTWSGSDNMALSGYQTKLDSAAWSSTTATSKTLSNLATGWHTFSVQSKDKAGNLSAIATFSFGVGSGYALTSPADQDRTQERVNLSGTGLSGHDYIWYRYRLGTAAAFADVPTADVTLPGTTTNPSKPVARDGNGDFPNLTWDVENTVNKDGLVEVEACFYTSTTDTSPLCSPASNLQLAAHAFGESYATDNVGPGSLSLLTGDYSLSAADASVATATGSLSVGRSLTTLAPAAASSGADGVFGPGWTADLPGPDTGAGDVDLSDYTSDGYVILTDSDGAESLYLAGDPNNGVITYAGQGDAAGDGSVLTKNTNASGDADYAGPHFTLLGPDGTKTIWTSPDSGTSWQVNKVVESGNNDTTSYARDGQGRVTQILAPAPGVNCSTPLTTVGCRTLQLIYAASAIARPGDTASTWGDYPSQLISVKFTAADPTHSNAMTTVDLAHYAYDFTGHLRAAWDPRLATAGKPLLKTTYSYDSNGRLASLTPASDSANSLQPYHFSYDGSGRLVTVSRTDPTLTAANCANGDNSCTSVSYGVPFTGASAPIDLSGAAVATWDQHDLPAAATAIFSPDHVPAGAPGSVDWPYATIHYLDVNGRETNTASFGAGAWQIDTNEYDQYGNTIRSLSAGSRAEALDLADPQNSDYTGAVRALIPSGGSCDATTSNGLPLCTVERADLLDTENTYTSDGTELLDTLEPLRPVRLDDGTDTEARPHSVNTYDQGAPTTGGPYRLVTTTVGSAQTADGVDHDAKTVTTGYDPINTGDTSGWTLRQPTKSTTVMDGGAADIVKISRYNADGQVIETRMPSEPTGGGAGSTLTSYYSSGTGTCGNAALVGLVCSTGPAAQPTTGSPLPTVTSSYDIYLQPVDVTETYGGSGTTRATHTDYDAAERPTTTTVTVTPTSAGGTAVPAVTTGYDPATGAVLTTTDGTRSITHHYDTLGREDQYTDADGNTAVTSYDIDGRIATLNDGKATTTYSYDGSGEHRGLVTGLDAGVTGNPSAFVGSYNAGGQLVSQTYPNGLVATTHYNEAGQPTELSYDAAGVNWLDFTVDAYSINGQIREQTSPQSNQQFSYDTAGRLTTTVDRNDVGATIDCTTRAYSFNANSDRTQLDSYPDDGSNPDAGGCSTATTPATTKYTVNDADQLTATIDAGNTSRAYTLDTLGRATSIPSVDAGGNGPLTAGYFANDLVASQSQTYADTSGLNAGQSRNHIGTWTLDPAGRLRTQARQQLDGTGTPVKIDDTVNPANTVGTTSITDTNHYADGGDAPAWIASADAEGATAWTRNVLDVAGNLAVIQSNTGTPQLQLADLHGDTVATVDDSTTAAGTNAYFESTEFGSARTTNTTTPARYGWLGAKRRSTDDLGGLTLMGVRLYDPATGRFLQVDPVKGGSANAYDYVFQDPINKFDLDGRCWTCWAKKAYHQAIRVVAVVPYAGYYAGYHANKWINQGHRWYREPLSVFRPVFWGWQAGGMAGDVGLDWVKGHTGFHESIYDEHQYGHINPLHGSGRGHTWLPGLYRSRGHTRLDWAW